MQGDNLYTAVLNYSELEYISILVFKSTRLCRCESKFHLRAIYRSNVRLKKCFSGGSHKHRLEVDKKGANNREGEAEGRGGRLAISM